MNDIAIWCAAWPGALLRLRAFGEDALLLAVAGMLLLGLLRGPLRWSGMAVGAAAIMLAWHTPQPDILVSGDGMQMAVRRTDGRLSIARAKGGDAFTLREWLAADADDRTSEARSLAEGVRCDEDGCTIRARDGALVSLALTPAGIAEDCDLAQVVATPRTAPPACAAVVIDRTRWKAQGAQALFAPSSKGARFEILAARPPGYDRPWAPARPVAADTAATPSAGQSPTGPNSRIPNAARDAEPSEQDTAIPGD